jgi:hypothetical protein
LRQFVFNRSAKLPCWIFIVRLQASEASDYTRGFETSLA